ncbi:MAG: helix-turn-helix domain-containing protein, partial [Deltaproteobacteria bacterium]|nr:helix-turn-helix domain-containing protein [Deltaproteobacteria bacterium]
MNVDLEVRKLKLGEKVKDLRLQKRYTLRQVAGNTGLSIALLSQIENNAVSPPVATLLRIARALDVNIG